MTVHGHTTSPNEYAQWRARLAGEMPPVDPRIPEPGCWRLRTAKGWLPVHIWSSIDQDTGEIVTHASLDGKRVPPAHVWPACSANPVTSIAYQHFMTHRKWACDIEPASITANNVMPAPGSITEAIEALQSQAIAWFESCGSSIKTKEQCDIAANYREEFNKLYLRSDEAMQEASQPHKKALAEINRQWKPVIAAALDAKTAITQHWIGPYMRERYRKRKEETIAMLKDPSLVAPKIQTGTGKTVYARARKSADLVDPRAFAAWLLSLNQDVPPQVVKALKSVANQLAWRGKENIPGVRIIENIEVV